LIRCRKCPRCLRTPVHHLPGLNIFAGRGWGEGLLPHNGESWTRGEPPHPDRIWRCDPTSPRMRGEVNRIRGSLIQSELIVR
jgi:hypothetical protein